MIRAVERYNGIHTDVFFSFREIKRLASLLFFLYFLLFCLPFPPAASPPLIARAFGAKHRRFIATSFLTALNEENAKIYVTAE